MSHACDCLSSTSQLPYPASSSLPAICCTRQPAGLRDPHLTQPKQEKAPSPSPTRMSSTFPKPVCSTSKTQQESVEAFHPITPAPACSRTPPLLLGAVLHPAASGLGGGVVYRYLYGETGRETYVKFAFLTIKCTVQRHYIHNVVQPSLLPVSKEMLLNAHLTFALPPPKPLKSHLETPAGSARLLVMAAGPQPPRTSLHMEPAPPCRPPLPPPVSSPGSG